MATTVFPKPSGWASATEDIPFTIAVTDWTASAGGGYQAEIVNTKFNVSSIELITYTVSVAEYLTANISKTKDAANNKLIFLTDSLPTGPISGNICCINNLSTSVSAAEKGVANGVASLDSSGKVPAQQLPSYVDDVLEYANQSAFPATGESGKIYVAIDTSKSYRWSGSAYVELSSYETATQSASGLMSATDKTKLDGIATGATANVVSNSLSDTSTTNALSAAKGKELNDKIESLGLETIINGSSLAELETNLLTYAATLEPSGRGPVRLAPSFTDDYFSQWNQYTGEVYNINKDTQGAVHAFSAIVISSIGKIVSIGYDYGTWYIFNVNNNLTALNDNIIKLKTYTSCANAYAALSDGEHGYAEVSNSADCPTSDTYYQVESWKSNSSWGWQTARRTDDNKIYVRNLANGTWSSWWNANDSKVNKDAALTDAVVFGDNINTFGVQTTQTGNIKYLLRARETGLIGFDKYNGSSWSTLYECAKQNDINNTSLPYVSTISAFETAIINKLSTLNNGESFRFQIWFNNPPSGSILTDGTWTGKLSKIIDKYGTVEMTGQYGKFVVIGINNNGLTYDAISDKVRYIDKTISVPSDGYAIYFPTSTELSTYGVPVVANCKDANSIPISAYCENDRVRFAYVTPNTTICARILFIK